MKALKLPRAPPPGQELPLGHPAQLDHHPHPADPAVPHGAVGAGQGAGLQPLPRHRTQEAGQRAQHITPPVEELHLRGVSGGADHSGGLGRLPLRVARLVAAPPLLLPRVAARL